ncbi:hypothetical protein [Arthrobacter sp. H5]|uniref:hypothetical protein n=1 Tax=Arthrobacter sp. H5 TaxID=1267973 RepID=UPI000486F8E8|nr:hypothetical protein [Arthrobacter sp. H5]
MLAVLKTPDGRDMDIALTTNGSALAVKAQSLKDAGSPHETPQRFTTTTDPKILALPRPAWINQPKQIPEQSAA